MRKREEKIQLAAQQEPLFACPVCGNAMRIEKDSLVCSQGHVRDFSRKGTVNFLSQQVATEYTATMLAARRRMLAAGLFRPFLDAMAVHLQPHQRLLDVGCGEGTPTAYLAEQKQQVAVGFDISAPAINLAGSLATPALFAVADLAHLPFVDAAFDTVTDIFSPGNYQEFRRVLRPDGQLLKIIPRAGYLKELRTGLYAGTAKAIYDNRPVLDRFLATFPQAEIHPITYDFPLAADQFADLLTMTPLSWQAPAERRRAMLANPLSSIHIEVDLLIVAHLVK
ncbi:methyltransferase domain-containing protein [Lacticaseibacillus casei]|uniref:methyltransferase domain-containing protein n=1 Tax=Lacticaseibacillus casei TaxID=1582 RepID=UPI00110987F8|nr:methyltransferase domain-containing protein [Lacticaseibacillus casei]TLQ51505.1 methyltransferase domain-containing protein [Lacticaseibacillus casei]